MRCPCIITFHLSYRIHDFCSDGLLILGIVIEGFVWMNTGIPFKRAFRSLVALVGTCGLLIHWYSAIVNRPADWSVPQAILDSVSQFTVQTNLFVLAWLAIAIIYWKDESQQPLLQPRIKGAFTLYITITFIIYAVIFAGSSQLEGLDIISNAINHYVTPIAFVLDWVLFEIRKSYQWRYAIQWLIYPLIYLVYSQIYGQITGDYLYPFFDTPVLGYGGLMIQVGILLVFFVILGCIYVAINKHLRAFFP